MAGAPWQGRPPTSQIFGTGLAAAAATAGGAGGGSGSQANTWGGSAAAVFRSKQIWMPGTKVFLQSEQASLCWAHSAGPYICGTGRAGGGEDARAVGQVLLALGPASHVLAYACCACRACWAHLANLGDGLGGGSLQRWLRLRLRLGLALEDGCTCGTGGVLCIGKGG